MKVAVFLNPTKTGIFEYAQKVTEKLRSCNIDVLFYEDYGQSLFDKDVYLCNNIDELVKTSDLILTIGGDGTIIHMAKYAARFFKPILGINFGRLGFVTGLEKDELDKLELLASGEYSVQNRSLLEVCAYKCSKVKKFLAVNDAVIFKGENTKIVDISVNLSGNEICNYRADGLIVSTSTGSTAYSMSAGGPIISPEIDCMLMTPICPHSMFSRPIVFSGSDFLEIAANAKENGNICLHIDGENVLNLSKFNKISIKCSGQRASFITFDGRPFYKRLSEKLLNRCDNW